MNDRTRLRASDDVVSRDVGGEMVLLDLASGTYFGLDPVGSCVWNALSDAGATLDELVDLVEATFDAPRARIEEDLTRLLGQLTEKQLVVSA